MEHAILLAHDLRQLSTDSIGQARKEWSLVTLSFISSSSCDNNNLSPICPSQCHFLFTYLMYCL